MEKFLRRQNYDKSVRNKLLNNQYNKEKSNWDYLKNPKEIEIMKQIQIERRQFSKNHSNKSDKKEKIHDEVLLDYIKIG